MMASFELRRQTAIITGGGTGLGFGMARCLAAAGANVVLIGRRESELARACASIGDRAFSLVGDITNLTSVRELVDRAEAVAGPITILVNNAGVHLKKPAIDTTDAEFNAVLQTHLFGAFALTREVGRRMVERERGSVIFVASMASCIGLPLVVAYSAAKSAYVGVVRTLASEWGSAGVRVNAIAPGWIETDMMRGAVAGDPARMQKILGRTPLRTLGKVDDIGWAAVYLASPAAAFVTGAVLPVDGGASIGF